MTKKYKINLDADELEQLKWYHFNKSMNHLEEWQHYRKKNDKVGMEVAEEMAEKSRQRYLKVKKFLDTQVKSDKIRSEKLHIQENGN